MPFYFSDSNNQNFYSKVNGFKSPYEYLTKSSIIYDNLFLYFDAGDVLSYPGSGTTWTDLSGNGNNGTLVNGVAYSSSNGGTLVFDGVNDYIQTSLIGRNTFLPISDFTMSIWVKFSRYPTSDNTTGCVFGAVNYQGYGIVWLGSTSNLSISCVMRSSTVLQQLSSPIDINSWYNVVFSYSYSENFTNFYVNGELVGSTQASSGVYNSNLSTSYPISINRNWIYGGSFGTQYFQGEVPQASIYSRALNSAEVQQNFDALRQRFGI